MTTVPLVKSHASYCSFRWETFCQPGMWLANVGDALGDQWPNAHIHAHCVVDDFGTLQPVAFQGLTASGDFVESGRAS